MTLEDVTTRKPQPSAGQRAAEELVRRARGQGLSLTGHLGREKNGPVVNEAGNIRNGSRPETVLTESTGQVSTDVPRDRDGTFEPQIARKRQPGPRSMSWRKDGAAIVRLWQSAREELIPFPDHDAEIRKVTCSANAIGSLNARSRRAVKARGHFPNEQAALKRLYLVTRSLDPTGTGRARRAMRWKPALNAFAITSGDRFPAAETC